MRVIEDIRSTIQKYPRRSVNFLLFCLAGVFLFVFGGVAPAYLNHVYLNQKINEARHKIEENKALQPLFQSLRSVPKSPSHTLTMPRRVVLHKSDIEELNSSFREIARQSGMKVVSMFPELASGGDSRGMVVNLSLRGDFENFRNVLKMLGELPYVDRIDEFAIQRAGNSRALDITMKILVAMN